MSGASSFAAGATSRVIDDIDTVLTTTRSVRRRLLLDVPVDRDIVLECVEIAVQAPTGGDQQDWTLVCIDDREMIAALAAVYRRTFAARHAATADSGSELPAGVAVSAWHLVEHFHRVPLVVIPYRSTPAPVARHQQAGFWASILPMTWSFMLAARSRGLVTAYTARAFDDTPEVARVIGIDAETTAMAGMIVVGHPDRLDFRPAARRGAAQVVRWNRDPI